MAKRRDRRAAPTPSSERRESRADKASTNRPDQFSEAAASDWKLITIFVLFFIVIPAVSVIVYRIKFTPKPYSIPPPQSLVKSDVDYQEILAVSTY